MGEHVTGSGGNVTTGGRDSHRRGAGGALKALAERAIAGGAYQEALNALVRGYQRAIISFCCLQLGRAGEGGRAEEVAQEVFLAAYQSLPRWQGQTPIDAWLFGIARKRCLQERRNYGRRVQHLSGQRDAVAGALHANGSVAPDEQALSEDDLERLRASLSQLRKWERELLTKRFFEDYTIAQLAQESTFWSESTVRNRLTQVLTRLRNIYLRGES